MPFEAVIGLEVHVQLKTASKLFCGCANRFGAEPNSLVCPICLGYPGALPVANRRAIDLAVCLALALEAEVQPLSVFARKNYFYPDLPKGYQISQYDRPLALGGRLVVAGEGRAVRIHRLHLEEDAGRLLHEPPGSGAGHSLVDFNRCGVPLVEIVTEPDLANAEEAQEFLQALHRILRYTDTSDGNMEEGSLRCDANVSLRPVGVPRFGTKTEIKNLNSFRNVARALDYEIHRQTRLLEEGEEVVQETRGFDADSGDTHVLRGKEEARDYRYFPEPDLPPLRLTRERIGALRASLPELPAARRHRFVDLGLPTEDAAVLTSSRELADYFEAALGGQSARARAVGNWVRGPLLAVLRERRVGIERAPGAARLAELVAAIEDGAISHAAGKDVLAALFDGDGAPRDIAARLGLVQVDDPAQVEAWVHEVLAAHAGVAAELQAGKTQALAFLVGQVMKRSAGRADPRQAQAVLRSALGIPV
jgi:aspartyl-tRNA(Asn)/glutamyl-tRNA(Gln) amidotransferase subunit B